MMNIFKKKIRRFVYYQKVEILTFYTSEENREFKIRTPLQFSYASIEEIKELNSKPEWDISIYPWEFLKEKIESGIWKAIVAKSEGNIVAYGFYSFNEMSIIGSREVEFDLPPHAAYIFRMFTHPEFRGLQIHRQLDNFRLKEVKKYGAAIAFTAVNSTNIFSINSCLKMGATVIGSVTFLKTRFFNKSFASKSLHKTGLKIKTIS